MYVDIMSVLKELDKIMCIEGIHSSGCVLIESEFSEIMAIGKNKIYVVGKKLASKEFALIASVLRRIELRCNRESIEDAMPVAREYLSLYLDPKTTERIAHLSAHLSRQLGIIRIIASDPDVERIIIRGGKPLIIITSSNGACLSNVRIFRGNDQEILAVIRELGLESKIEFIRYNERKIIGSVLRSSEDHSFNERNAKRYQSHPELLAYLHMAIETGNNIVVSGHLGRLMFLNLIAYLVPQETKTLMSGYSLKDCNNNRKYIHVREGKLDKESLSHLVEAVNPDLLILEDASRELKASLRISESGINIIASIDACSRDTFGKLRSCGIDWRTMSSLDILIFVDNEGNYTISECNWLSRAETFEGKVIDNDLLEEVLIFGRSVFVERNLPKSKVIRKYASINGLSQNRALDAFRDRISAQAREGAYAALEEARLSFGF